MQLRTDLMRSFTQSFISLKKSCMLPIFTFHRIGKANDPYDPNIPEADTFESQLLWIKDQFEVIPLDIACRQLFAGKLRKGAAAITFDDGHIDNFEVALPILKRHDLLATFFVCTGFLEGRLMFNDFINAAIGQSLSSTIDLSALGLGCIDIQTQARRGSIIEALVTKVKYIDLEKREEFLKILGTACKFTPVREQMMNVSHLKQLVESGMQIGAHTKNHPILRLTSEKTAFEEINGCADTLENILGFRPALFAYPNGKHGDDYDERDASIVKSSGFEFAFSTEYRVATNRCDPYQVPRLSLWSKSRIAHEARIIKELLIA